MKKNTLFLSTSLLLSGALVFFYSCQKSALPDRNSLSATERTSAVKPGGGGDVSGYSGEEIFRGIFFLEGDLPLSIASLRGYATDLQRLAESDENVRAHRTQLADVIVRNIQARDPEFFNTFERKIKSENLYEVNDVLMQSGRMIEMAGMATEEYANMFKWGTELLNNPETLGAIKDIDVSTEEGVRQLDEFVRQNQLESTKFLACTPAAAICVYYAIAVAHSQAAVTYNVVGAVNLIGYFTVIVKTKVLFWSRVTSDPNSETMNELFVNEIAAKF